MLPRREAMPGSARSDRPSCQPGSMATAPSPAAVRAGNGRNGGRRQAENRSAGSRLVRELPWGAPAA